MNNEPMPLAEALATIRTALGNPQEPPQGRYPTSLDRPTIARMVSIFQPRELDGRWAEDERHTENLAALIGSPERPSYLDAMTVWWGGDRWYIIDGHHRLVAYDRAQVRKSLPVQVFEGTLEDAMAEAARSNSKDRLVMRQEDKLNFAWKLTLTTGLSKARVAEACGASERTVANMRSVRDKLKENPEVLPDDLLTMPWPHARMLAEGKEMSPDFDPDEALRKRADVLRHRHYKAFGDTATRDPEAYALALRLSNDRLPSILMQTRVWDRALRSVVDDLKSELPGADEVLAQWPETASEEEALAY